MTEINQNEKQLPEETADRLINIIVSHEYTAGQKLPNEYALSQELGVGRNTVREAVRSLVSRNILEIRRGAGTFISHKMGIADDPFGLTFIKDKHKAFLDLMEVRFMLEPPIAALAAQNATPEDIQRLQELMEETARLILAGKPYIQPDIAFHTQISRCSQNTIVPRIIPIIHETITAFTSIRENTNTMATLEHHREIFEAIRDHRSYDAEDAIRLHLAYNRNKLKKSTNI